MTRADQFRAMTDEELAAFIHKYVLFDTEWCHGGCPEDCPDDDACLACALRWLREDAE